ncbi:SDR family oxidoreductase [Negadavirga shengliensis]|uniref:SDR family oxidoreductase n=1 Tax=Negadavirga shengliensis TaxID=1389218 RepID=A0ABV9T934_9BACT
MKKVLIAGASGTAGRTITKMLVGSGRYIVYGLTHKQENQSRLQDLGCIPVLANLTDMEQGLEAIKEIQPEIVISSVMGSGERPGEQELQMGKNLIEISKETRIATYVYISVFQCEIKTGIPHFEVKAKIEQLLKSSGLNHIVIRPATFMDSLFMPWFLQTVKEQSTLVSPMELNTKISYLHTLDIAELVLYVLQQNLPNETYTIGGRALSIRDLQQTLAEKTQTEIRYQKLPPEQVRQMAGKDIALMVDYFNNHGFEVPENTLPKDYKPQLREFEEEIDQYL